MNIEQLKYPIGKHRPSASFTKNQLNKWIDDIASFPTTLENLVANLSLQEKQYSYRPGGWNIMQLVHHCADSHMNSLIRFKLALTESQPTIKPYDENQWVELADSMDENLSASIALLKGLHHKWVYLLRKLTDEEYAMTYLHPADKTVNSLAQATSVYAWHSNHHLAHIQQALMAKGKYNETH